jgi:hypothetical protein
MLLLLPILRSKMSADAYTVLLREHNRQRNKTVAEQIMEELVDIDPDKAYQNLKMSRLQSLQAPKGNGFLPLEIEGKKKRYGISAAKADHVKLIRKVVYEELKDYWPLSIRRVHYSLLNHHFYRNISQKLLYQNDARSYSTTSNLITRLRIKGEIEWAAFDDFTRPLREFRAFRNVREYVDQEINSLFEGYWRDLLQSQDRQIECVCEKNTVYHLALRVMIAFLCTTSGNTGNKGKSAGSWPQTNPPADIAPGRARWLPPPSEAEDPDSKMRKRDRAGAGARNKASLANRHTR